ncbi:adenine deaminase [Veillonella agrestimuris]|uniref:adenine deaminase n=1 Tax=Veillonella agrestimuris TaxID=2941340 RepID=UPI00203F180D|nr:adenine deaminase [Veillonella agrestimuris]
MKYTKELSNIAQGLEKAPLVLKGAHVLDVGNEVWDVRDIAIADGYIVGVGDYEGIKEIDYSDKYIVPAFIDAHLHLESTLVNPRELVFEASREGTLTYIVDPHEAGNVAGIKGIQYMIDETREARGDVYVMAPSCVPAIPGEDNGALLDSKALTELLDNPAILGLAEVMDCYGVIGADPDMLAKIDAYKGGVLDGHIIGLSQKQLAAYRLAGITTNHECITYEDAREQVRQGLYVWIREGSAAHNLEAIVKGIINSGSPVERYGFCTDDKHIEDIRREGHISYNIRRAIELGLMPIKAYKMASTYPAQCYDLRDAGWIAPGYKANLVVLDDEITVSICDVIYNGEIVDRHSEYHKSKRPVPPALLNTINIGDFKASQLDLPIDGPHAVINIIPGQIVTAKTEEIVPSENGIFKPNSEFNKITCIERYKASGRNGVGVLKGFNIHNGAIATSFAHDSHNLIVVGDNDTDMMIAIERIKDIGGGYVMVENGQIIGELALEIMGLITNEPHDIVDAKVAHMKEKAYAMGISKDLDPFINLSFLALTVIPAIRVTTKGVVEC